LVLLLIEAEGDEIARVPAVSFELVEMVSFLIVNCGEAITVQLGKSQLSLLFA
jgi:hypothetical protein